MAGRARLMISLERVAKRYPTVRGEHIVLKDVSLRIEKGEKIGILGRNGSGKSTLIRLIGGAERPSSGRIRRSMSVSWPLAFGGGFHGSLSGLDNVRFICRIYGADIAVVLPYVEEFAELGKFLKQPTATYSSGMMARLAFALSMAIEFDCFLIDEVIAVGDARFQDRCQRELFEKRRDRSLIIVSHEVHNIRDHCSRAYVLRDGMLHAFSDVDSAYRYYNSERSMDVQKQ
jgi:capsular polysaccharide transport system ATP-binding protein